VRQYVKTGGGVTNTAVTITNIELSNNPREGNMLIPRVVKDHNSKTAILFKEGRKFVHFIPMKSGKLTIKRVPIVRFFNTYQDADIPLERAVTTYLIHSGGHTESALKELTIMQECFGEYSA
jgi:hypothetical protein